MQVLFYRTGFGRSPVEDFIGDLSKQDQARFRDVFEGVKKYGLECPRATFKQLRGKLWEIKFQSASGGFRIAYATQKTPLQDLDIALKRMKEVL